MSEKKENSPSSGCVTVRYETLDLNQPKYIQEAFECIAECFTGVDVNGIRKSEPMNMAVGLDKETVMEYHYKITQSKIAQGYCFVAVDQTTDKVVGASLSEIYQPFSENHHFEGNLYKYNEIFRFLEDLDSRFKKLYKFKTGKNIEEGLFLHCSVVGIKAKALNGNIFEQFLRMTEEAARRNGLLGLVTEATNPRSQKPMQEKFGFIQLRDSEGRPISRRYEEDETFKVIPKEVSEECQLLYKPLSLRLT